MSDERICVIRLNQSTRERLKDLGKKGETYDAIIQKAIECMKRQ